MTVATKIATAAVSAVTRIKNVDDILSPHTKVITDLQALIEQREDLIVRAQIRYAELSVQKSALRSAIRMHEEEIERASKLRDNFRDLLDA